MEFLNKSFTSKEDLAGFIKDYCYNFGYLTFIRSSSNKKGLVRIMCNSTGATKSGSRGSPPAEKKQKFGDCPFVACGRRVSEAVNTTTENWQITIFNNSHNHLPVIDFSAPSTLNVSESNLHHSQGLSTSSNVYNPVLDVYETHVSHQSNNNQDSLHNLTLNTDLFTTRIIKNIHSKLQELSNEEKKLFLNRFNKLLYEDMPKLRAKGQTNDLNQQSSNPQSTIIPAIVNTTRNIRAPCENCGEPGHLASNCSIKGRQESNPKINDRVLSLLY